MKRRALKHKLHQIIEAHYDSWLGKLDQIILSILIVLDISSLILETSQPFDRSYHWLFRSIAIFSTIIFTVEYGLRLWSCTVERQYRHPFWGRVRYALTPMAIVDLISTFPFYLILVFQNLAFLKTLRLLRLARIIKIGRYSKAVRSLARVIISKQEELLITCSIISFLLIIASSLMFFAEHDAQPEIFSSIPASMWWGVVTLTTVGYGDIYPVTTIGKLLGSCLAFFGIGVFVLPAGIVASGFAREVTGEAPVDRDSQLELTEERAANDLTAISQPYRQIQADAKLLKYCLHTARQELGSMELDNEAIDSWAMFLYFQAKQDLANPTKLIK